MWDSVRTILLASNDGLTQWRAVFESIRRHMEGQAALVPIIGLGIGLVVLLLLDYLAARWIARRLCWPHRRHSGRPTSSRRPG